MKLRKESPAKLPILAIAAKVAKAAAKVGKVVSHLPFFCCSRVVALRSRQKQRPRDHKYLLVLLAQAFHVALESCPVVPVEARTDLRRYVR